MAAFTVQMNLAAPAARKVRGGLQKAMSESD